MKAEWKLLRPVSFLAGVMMLGSAGIAGASGPEITAGQDTFNFNFHGTSCADCNPMELLPLMEWLWLREGQDTSNVNVTFNFNFYDNSCKRCRFNFDPGSP